MIRPRSPFRPAVMLALVLAAAASLGGCITTSPDAEKLARTEPAAGPGHESGNSLLQLAQSMASEGANSAAIPLYRRAYQKSGDRQALIGLGRALTANGEYLEAIKTFKTAGVDDPAALRGIANAYIALHQPELALPLLEKALSQNPADLNSLSSKAVALDLLGRYDEATAVYEQGLQIDPEQVELRHNYGLALALTNTNFPRALQLLRGATGAEPGSPTGRQTLALAYALSGDDATAARLISIDMGSEEAAAKMAYFQLIKSLPTRERFAAVISGSQQPKHDLAAPALRTFTNDDAAKAATTTRILEETAPPAASAAPATMAAAPTPAVAAELAPTVAAPPAQERAEKDWPAKEWGVQIAAYRNTAQADKGWRIFKSRYSELLGALEPFQSYIDFGQRPKKPNGKYYRLISGPLKNRAEAIALCRKLREKGAECMIRKPQEVGVEAP